MILLRILVSLWLAMGGVAAVAAPQQPDLYVMRHLEYRGTGSHARLSEIGANNARRLADAFRAFPPAAIYTATEQVSLDSSAWLAIEVGVNPKLFDPERPDALLAEVRTLTGTVLIVASKDYAADIIARASGRPAPDIAEDAFGEVWVISGRDRSVIKKSLYAADGAAAAPNASTSPWLDEGEIAERKSTNRN